MTDRLITEDDQIVCWRCGASLAGLMLPLGRRESCPACDADLHVCRQCAFHDPTVARACREPVADEVTRKEHANFCGYFAPVGGRHPPGVDRASIEARRALDALFGDDGDAPNPTTADPLAEARAAFEARRDGEADAAKRELERLFGLDDDKG